MIVTHMTPAEKKAYNILSEFARINERNLKGYADALAAIDITEDKQYKADKWLEDRQIHNVHRTISALKQVIDQFE